MSRLASTCLMAAGIGDFLLALLHLAIIAIGPAAYLYFGAAGMAVLARRGSPAPTIITLGITAVFAIWGCYAFSGAGVMRPLPLVRFVLAGIAFAFILRGLIVVPDLVRLVGGAGYPLRQSAFSTVSLCLGVLHFVGARELFRTSGSPIRTG